MNLRFLSGEQLYRLCHVPPCLIDALLSKEVLNTSSHEVLRVRDWDDVTGHARAGLIQHG